jgi:hypothetical protein
MKIKTGFWSTIGGGFGVPIAQAYDPTLSMASILQIAFASTATGIVADSFAESISLKVGSPVRSQLAIRDKLRAEFAQSPLRSWSDIELKRANVVKNLARAGLADTQDHRLKGESNLPSLRKYLVLSNCWDGKPRSESVKILQKNGPFLINATSHNTSIQAGLNVMEQDFGIRLQIDGAYWHGVEQVAAIDSGKEAEFSIVADSNVFFAQHNRMAKDYRLLIPCFLGSHKLVRKRGVRKHDSPRLYFASGTSAEEQVLLGDDLQFLSKTENRALDVKDLIEKLRELTPEEGIIAWDPLLRLHNIPRHEYLIDETTSYRFSTSLYCHKTLLARQDAYILNAFQDCFIAAWNRARIYELESYVRLVGSDCRKNFELIKERTAGRAFTDLSAPSAVCASDPVR